MTDQQIALIVITFGAAIVNGALGYGFSSITVPLALLFMTNRVLNPALVPIEVVLNAYVLWVNREALPHGVAAGAADRHRPGAGRRARHHDGVAGQPGLAEVRHLPRAAAAHPAAGGRLPPADQVRKAVGLRLRRRRRRALLGHDHLRALRSR